MMKRVILIAALAAIALVACNKKQEQTETPKDPHAQTGEMPQGHPDISSMGGGSAVAGAKWTVPQQWSVGPARQMRVATYMIPAASGDPEGGECAVFYFGGGQGGDVESNIERWVGQFVDTGKPERSTKEVNGMKVELVKVTGSYTAPSGPMMQATAEKKDYRLLGAIVAAPEGSVFFKLTGPGKTIKAAESDFNALIGSLSK